MSRLTSSFTCQLISVIITTLIIHHSFTLSFQAQTYTFSTNPSHLRLLIPTGLPSWQWDWTGPITLIGLFLVSHFNFLFVPCGGLSWLPVSFLVHVKYTLSYRIVSYRNVSNTTSRVACCCRCCYNWHICVVVVVAIVLVVVVVVVVVSQNGIAP